MDTLSGMLLLLLLQPATAAYQEVYELDVRTYPKVHEGDSVWLVLWYAPWCGHCKKLAPVYEKVAEHFHRQQPGRVSVARVDATAHPGLAAPFDLKGYPTLVLLRGGTRIADFKGPRTFEGLVDFVEGELTRPPGAPPLEPAAPQAKPKGKASAKSTLARLLGRRSEWRVDRGIQWLKRTVLALLTEYDPLTAGLAMLACTIAGGACLVAVLCLTTKASDRPPDS